MRQFKNRLLFVAVVSLCAILSLGSVFGCSSSSSNISDAETTEEEATKLPSIDLIEGYDVCYKAASSNGDSYFLIDANTRYIYFFSYVPGVLWFDNNYSGDLNNGLYVDCGNDSSVSLKYSDLYSDEKIIADYSYGESYEFEKASVSSATLLLDKLIADYLATSETTSYAVVETTTQAVTERFSEPTVKTVNYIANKNTKKFHYPSCSSVRDMSPGNKWEFTGTREELINMGYVPCKRCYP